jgi:hypothetical protein
MVAAGVSRTVSDMNMSRAGSLSSLQSQLHLLLQDDGSTIKAPWLAMSGLFGGSSPPPPSPPAAQPVAAAAAVHDAGSSPRPSEQASDQASAS